MLVKNGDILQRRGGNRFTVVCADKECFVTAKRFYDLAHKCYTTNYASLQAYSNVESINTLEQLGFMKIEEV